MTQADGVVAIHGHSDADGDSVLEPLPQAAEIADTFSADAIVVALEAIRERRIDYPQFLREIMEAGSVQYAVYLTGHKAIYFGRRGEFHVENFPPEKVPKQ